MPQCRWQSAEYSARKDRPPRLILLKLMKPPEQPTAEIIRACLLECDALENYTLQEHSLLLLFKKLCPTNTAIHDILLKVTVLNQFYSTNIYDVYSVSKHILSKRIDERLANGDPLLVNELATVAIKGKTRNFYSFATKYCNHHVPDSFPIYDYFVETMLLHFQRADGFSKFTRKDLKTYPCFVNVIQDFRAFYRLEGFNLRQIDIYLWLEGKKAFPRVYQEAKPPTRAATSQSG